MSKILISWSQFPKEFSVYKNWVESLGYEWSTTEGDLLLVVGGKDIGIDLERDAYENNLIDEFRKAGKPIFGICRGFQLLGIKEGLKLISHLPDVENLNEHRSDKSNHHGNSNFHSIFYTRSNGAAVKFDVNSRHHQGFVGNKNEWAYSEDGVIEALKTDWFSAVQWHPEREEVRGKLAEIIASHTIKNLLSKKYKETSV